MSRGAQTPRASETITPLTLLAAHDGRNAELDRVREVDELPLEVELLREPLRERLDADTLRRVVAGRDEVDAELARGVEARLRRLAGEEEVVAVASRFGQIPCGATRDDRCAIDPLRPLREHDRLAPDLLADALLELGDRRRLLQRASEPDVRKRVCWLDSELTREQGVVANLGMRVEGEVIRRQRDLRVEESLQAPAHGVVDHP